MKCYIGLTVSMKLRCLDTEKLKRNPFIFQCKFIENKHGFDWFKWKNKNLRGTLVFGFNGKGEIMVKQRKQKE